MKICHVSTVHPAMDIRIFHKECRALVRAGYEVALVARHDKSETVGGVHIIPIPQAKNKISRMIMMAFSAFQIALRQHAVIYHLHDPELVPYALIMKWLGKKVIYDSHEDWPRNIMNKDTIPRALRRAVSWLFGNLEDFAARRFDAVIAATHVITDRFLKLGCSTVEIRNYPMLNELQNAEVHWSDRDRAICYIGRIDRIRGALTMMEAIERVDVKLILAGEFTPPGLRDTMLAAPGGSKINYLGIINRDEVARALSRSRAGLVILHPVSNYLESLPIKLFEYMSAGIPAIASDFPLWRGIVEGNQCGICVDPMNPDDIANAIQWIIEHPVEAEKMGNCGRKAVETKYNWEQEKQKLIKLYRSILGN